MRFARVMPGALLSWLPFTAGCSLFFDFTVEQCKFDADCNDLSSGETQLWCEQGLCISRTDCKHNSDCKSDTPARAQICVASKCQKLRQGNCFEHFPSVAAVHDDAIVLGAFSQQRGPNPVMPLLNYELAVSELNSADGLNGRQVVLVVCDNGYGSDDEASIVKSGLDHLAKTLRVPAIVAGMMSVATVHGVFPKDASEAPFFLVPFAGDGTVIEDDHELLWYLLNPTDYSPALVALAQHVEAGLQQRGLAVSTRVVAWNGASQTASALWESLKEPLGEAFPALDVIEAGSGRELDDVVAARPHILLAIEGESFVDQLGELEARWADSERPVYLLPPQVAASERLRAFLKATPAVDPARFVGVHPRHLGDPRILEDYAGRFNQHFSLFSRVINGWNYYDAVYYLAYAAFAATPKGTVALTNADVLRGFKKLWTGDDVEIGPDNIPSAVAALSNDDANIRFVGTLGPADFHGWTGTPTEAGAAVFCLTRTDDDVVYGYDVLFYNADTHELEAGDGDDACSDLLIPANSP